MGYRPKFRQFKLVFTADDYAGLEVEVRSVSTGLYLDLVPGMEAFRAGRTSLDQAAALLSALGEHLVAWNVEGADGQPLPATLDGVRTLDLEMAVDIMSAWFEGMVAPPAPLDGGSTSGETSPEVSLPMDPL